jgi:hypothetical protein
LEASFEIVRAKGKVDFGWVEFPIFGKRWIWLFIEVNMLSAAVEPSAGGAKSGPLQWLETNRVCVELQASVKIGDGD